MDVKQLVALHTKPMANVKPLRAPGPETGCRAEPSCYEPEAQYRATVALEMPK